MSASNRTLDVFRNRRQLRSPRFIRDRLETVRVGADDGVRLLEHAPATDILIGHPPTVIEPEDSLHRYLWIIDARGIPYIIERPLPATGGNLPKHTNLTGGGEAYVGGELWFTSSESMYLSGGSGRYPPTSEPQLDEAVEVFESFGYSVISLGWDEGYGARRWLGETP